MNQRDTRRASIVATTDVGMDHATLDKLSQLTEESHMETVDADLAIMSPKAREFDEEAELCLGDFEMGVTLGLGSFGRVRLARYRRTGKHYAIKMMNKAAVLQMKQLEHIRSEKNILVQIAYPFVVNMFGTFQDETTIYMVFEFVCGGEFFTLLRNEDKLPNDQARFYATEIALTLSFLHNLKIVYRDLKPENLLIDKDGHLKITDFGFAKEVEDRTWTLCGTPDYIAPEIIRNKGHNKGADWWAFGVLLFEMLAGYPPFYDESGGFGTYKKILKGMVEYPEDIQAEAVDLMSKLLVADLTKRFGNLHKGAGDIMDHPFFDTVDWNMARRKEIVVPMIPDIEGENDTSYFEEYDDEDEHVEQVCTPPLPRAYTALQPADPRAFAPRRSQRRIRKSSATSESMVLFSTNSRLGMPRWRLEMCVAAIIGGNLSLLSIYITADGRPGPARPETRMLFN